MAWFKFTPRQIARTGAIAGLYLALTFLFSGISFGPLQVRIAEALTLLPILFPEAVPALFLGCFLANLLGPYGAVDIVFGSLTTLLAALLTYRFRRLPLGWLSPIVCNALGVSLYLYAFFRIPYWPTVLTIGLGESIAVLALGLPLLHLLKTREKQR
ncbi:MAG: QueT transporter family protein [Dethiobacteria bacterium]|jgi:uncharacterized membrane protein